MRAAKLVELDEEFQVGRRAQTLITRVAINIISVIQPIRKVGSLCILDIPTRETGSSISLRLRLCVITDRSFILCFRRSIDTL